MKFTQVLVASAAVSSAVAWDVSSIKDSMSSLVPRAISNLLPRKGGNDGGSGGNGSGGSGACPAVWSTIVQDLTANFTANGQCTDDARAAIRAAFHDAGTWNTAQGNTGGADGSLILAQEAFTRSENNGLQDISTKLLALSQKRGVGVADLIQFAAALGIILCPGGPQIKTYVGRKDSSNPAPHGLLPDVHASGDSLYALFQDKSFSAEDLAALLGAHSTSKQFFVDQSLAGEPQDSTPGIWDVKYYTETTNPVAGDFVFPSDKNLAAHPVVGKQFAGFVNNQGKWTGKFADAMSRMSLLGVPGGSSNLIDCTNVLPSAISLNKRMRGENMFMPRH